MSRAFVKEDETATGAATLPDRPIGPEPNLVTARGLALITATLADAHAALAAARAADDKAGQAHAARDARYWAARQASAQLVAPPDGTETVRFGTIVTIQRADGRAQGFRIVGQDESDPAQATLAHTAPLARAVLGHGVGDVVLVGADAVEIIGIALPPDRDTPA